MKNFCVMVSQWNLNPMPNKTQKPRRLLLLLHLSNTPSFIQELSKVEDEETYTIENGSAFKKKNIEVKTRLLDKKDAEKG